MIGRLKSRKESRPKYHKKIKNNFSEESLVSITSISSVISMSSLQKISKKPNLSHNTKTSKNTLSFPSNKTKSKSSMTCSSSKNKPMNIGNNNNACSIKEDNKNRPKEKENKYRKEKVTSNKKSNGRKDSNLKERNSKDLPNFWKINLNKKTYNVLISQPLIRFRIRIRLKRVLLTSSPNAKLLIRSLSMIRPLKNYKKSPKRTASILSSWSKPLEYKNIITKNF